MPRIYHWIRALFKRKRHGRSDIAARLSPEVRAELAREAAFLRNLHGVSVASMASGESGRVPHPVDSAVEERLPPLNADPVSDG